MILQQAISERAPPWAPFAVFLHEVTSSRGACEVVPFLEEGDVALGSDGELGGRDLGINRDVVAVSIEPRIGITAGLLVTKRPDYLYPFSEKRAVIGERVEHSNFDHGVWM